MSSGIVESQSGSSDRDRKEQSARSAGPRALAVQRLLAAAGNLPQFIYELLRTQATMVAGTEAAAFIVERAEQSGFSLRPIGHIRPDESAQDVRDAAVEAFKDIVRPFVQQERDGAAKIDAGSDASEAQFCLVTMLRSEGAIVAVSAVICRCLDDERAKQRLSSMGLIAGYFEYYTLRRTVDQARQIAASHQNVLQLSSTFATAEGFEAGCINLCNDLAARTGATRVAVGWVVSGVTQNQIKLKAMSHTEKFDKKQELSVMIIKAMEECLDQAEIVQYEPDGEGSNNVKRTAAELSRTQGGVSVLSLPLRRRDDIIGVITLEFNPQKKLAAQGAQSLAVATELLAPQLYDRFQNDRWLVTKAAISTRETAKLAIGPKHMLAKTIIALSIASLVFLSLYKPMFRVSAPFTFAALESQKLSAPFEGFVESVGKNAAGAELRPGDRVKKGDVLLKLRIEQLELQRDEALAEAIGYRIESRKYRDEGKTAEADRAESQATAQEKRAAQFDEQVKQSEIRADVDGVIVNGDWTDKKGAPVKKGDQLFEVASIDKLRVEMKVNERDIQWVDESGSQRGMLATTSLPDERFPFTVERVIPSSEPSDGANVFIVYGKLDPTNTDGQWRPKMAGEARIDVNNRPLLWQWTHRVVEFIRLKLWI